jgi:hypothetical protein
VDGNAAAQLPIPVRLMAGRCRRCGRFGNSGPAPPGLGGPASSQALPQLLPRGRPLGRPSNQPDSEPGARRGPFLSSRVNFAVVFPLLFRFEKYATKTPPQATSSPPSAKAVPLLTRVVTRPPLL